MTGSISPWPSMPMAFTSGAIRCRWPWPATCHSYGGHINLPRYNRVSNPYGSGCVNCHITTHGSNHPSGAKFTR